VRFLGRLASTACLAGSMDEARRLASETGRAAVTPDGDLVEGDEAGDAFNIGVVADPAVDALDVLGKQFVLGAAGFELLRGIEEEYLVAAIRPLASAKDEDPQAVSELKVSLEGELASAPADEAPSEAAPDAPVVQAGAPCACADNQAVLASLQKRVKTLENWKKRGVRSSKFG
jgi:hypothetical protein